MHDVTTIKKSSHANLKWAWNENEHELFTPITSNKNENPPKILKQWQEQQKPNSQNKLSTQ
jgi:hypothetical protein